MIRYVSYGYVSKTNQVYKSTYYFDKEHDMDYYIWEDAPAEIQFNYIEYTKKMLDEGEKRMPNSSRFFRDEQIRLLTMSAKPAVKFLYL